jgi:AAA domain
MGNKFIRADGVQPQPVRYQWRQHVPAGMLSLIAGPPGEGKSLAACHVASEVSQSAPVIFSTREDALAQVVRPRLEVAGARLDRVHLWRAGALPEQIEELEAKIRRHRVKLVVLDPVSSHLSVPISATQRVRLALERLHELGEATGCGFVLVSHVLKTVSARSHPLAAVGGASGGLTGVCRIVHLFGRDSGDENTRVLAPAKSNLGSWPPSLAFTIESVPFAFPGSVDRTSLELGEDESHVGRLVFEGESEVTSHALVRGVPQSSSEAGKRWEATEWLLGYLRLGPRPVAEIREDSARSEHAWRTVRRAADDLGVIRSGGPGSTWELPEELREQ